MSDCKTLNPLLFFKTAKNWYNDELCCWDSPTRDYNYFLTALTHTYNQECKQDKVFSDYVTQLFTDCLSGSSSSHTHTSDVYWSGNSDGSISPSGLTTHIGIGTSTPNEELTVVGTISATTNVDIGGDFIGDGDLDLRDVGITSILLKARYNQHSHIGNSTTTANLGVGTITPNEKLTVNGSISGNAHSYISGNTFNGGTIQANTFNATSQANGYQIHNKPLLWLSTGSGLQVGNMSVDTYIVGTSISLQTATTVNHNLTVTGVTYLGKDLHIKDDQFIYFGAETDTDTRIRRNSNNLKIEATDDILLLPDDDLKIGVGGTQYAIFDGGTNSLSVGTTSVPTARLTLKIGQQTTNFNDLSTVEGCSAHYLYADMVTAQESTMRLVFGETTTLEGGVNHTFVIFPTPTSLPNEAYSADIVLGGYQIGANCAVEILRIDGSASRVGIKQQTPLYDLDVTGTFRATTNAVIGGDIDVDGVTNLDNTDIDGTFTMDGTAFDVNATTTLALDNTNTTNGVTINTVTSGSKVFIGHTTSETTVNDNLSVTGDLAVDGTSNLDNTDIDGTFTMDGTAFDVNGTTTVAIDNTNTTNGITIGTVTSAVPISIGHATSETTVNDNLSVTGDIAVDGTSNLDNTDIDGTLVVDGSNISLDSTSTLNIDNSNTSNGITIGTATSAVPVSIGHTTSETTVNDNLTVTGDATIPTRKYELPSNTVGDFKGGDIYYYGNGSTVKGSIYYINGTNWTLADADLVASSTVLLAVALGTDPDVDGMLLRGFVTLLTEVEGTEAIGSVLYLSATDTGIATTTAPSGTGDVVRVVGYSLHATDNQIYFNPDPTWVELT